MTEQLTLDFDAPVAGATAEAAVLAPAVLLAEVAEPGMTAEELEAVVKDALGEARAKPCRCSSPMVLRDELAFEVRCVKCGREPRR